MATNLWTADRRLYLDAAGKVVEADNPARASLLVAQGGTILMDDAIRYGLVAEPKAAAPAAANKAVRPAAQNKGDKK
jgi:predicted O-methyltransferase YrrM